MGVCWGCEGGVRGENTNTQLPLTKSISHHRHGTAFDTRNTSIGKARAKQAQGSEGANEPEGCACPSAWT